MASINDLWLVLGGMALGVLALASGVAVRRGRLRYQLSDYWKPERPLVYRNLPLVQIPSGAALVLVGIAWLLWAYGEPSVRPLSSLLGAFALACLIGVLVWLPSAPGFLKPDWLRREEAHRPSPRAEYEATIWRVASLIVIAALSIGALGALLVGVAGLWR